MSFLTLETFRAHQLNCEAARQQSRISTEFHGLPDADVS